MLKEESSFDQRLPLAFFIVISGNDPLASIAPGDPLTLWDLQVGNPT
jgi:hypothetical protein